MVSKKDDIVIKFGGDDSRFQKAVKRVGKSTEGIRNKFRGVGDQIGNFFGVRLAGGIGLVSTALVGLAKSSIASADAMGKVSSKVGIGVEDLQKLRYAASTAGVEQNALDTAMQRFSRRVGEAAKGTGELYKDITALGIPLRDETGRMRELTDILGDYAEAIKNAESPQEQLRLTFKAFDTEGAALVNVLRLGKEGMASLGEEAVALGGVLDENLVQHSIALNQAWDDFATSVSKRFTKAMLTASRALDQAAENYRTVDDIQEKIASNEAELIEQRESLTKAHRLGRPAIERYIESLDRENEAYREQVKALKDVKNAKSDANAATPVATPVATPGAPGAKPGGAKPGGAKTKGGREAQREVGDRVDRSAEEETGLTGTDWQDAYDPRKGAAGTDWQKGYDPADDGKTQAERNAEHRQSVSDRSGRISELSEQAAGGIADLETGGTATTTAMDAASMDAWLKEFFDSHSYSLKVAPELVGDGGIERMAQTDADKFGGTP